ncbi:tubulin polyglutamylase TTLL11 [Aplysia californica]|uniref:Tubulin polyglutamylase TTLL11 n=1 Tax=Aplysia californica TaxID=6500 RepID=A0ABM0JB49_APLCA|nr:tubulin polyglutamylase TTLL11 [Aplysia californica]
MSEEMDVSNGSPPSLEELEQTDGAKPVTIDTTYCDDNIDILKIMMPYMRWKQVDPRPPGYPCDIYWHYDTFLDQTGITSGQVNRFPGSREICQKINLSRWLIQMQSLYPEEFNFVPRTYLLPEQFDEFAAEVNKTKGQADRPTFIVKPSDGHRGIGVYVMQDMAQFTDEEDDHYVAQEYVSDVFTMNTFKFDLRIHAVIRSVSPLEFYICDEGQVRLATMPYTKPTAENIRFANMHLTNFMVNVQNQNYVLCDEDNVGSQRLFSAWLKQLGKEGYDTKLLWQNIELLVAKTLIGMTPQMLVDYHAAIPDDQKGPTCFQIVGFDILLRDNLEPVLLEVNHDPSIRVVDTTKGPSGEMEKGFSVKSFNIRRKLLRDTMLLVTPKGRYSRPRRKPQPHQGDTTQKVTGPYTPENVEVEKNEEGEDKSSLIQLVPKLYGKQLQPCRTLERIAEIFIASVPSTGSAYMSRSAFKDFVKKCEFDKNMSSSEVDELFCTIEQANLHLNPKGTTGLSFFAFVSACTKMAADEYPRIPFAVQLSSFAENCERLLGLPGLKTGTHSNGSSSLDR